MRRGTATRIVRASATASATTLCHHAVPHALLLSRPLLRCHGHRIHILCCGRAEWIVEGTIRLACSMDMRVVAEGIEDEVQARKLYELGHDMGQGWLYARAMSAHDLRDWLGARMPEGGKVIPLRRVTV